MGTTVNKVLFKWFILIILYVFSVYELVLNLENPFKSAKSGLLEISWNQNVEASPSSLQVCHSPPKTPEQQISDYKKGLAHLLNNGGVFRRGRTGSGEKQPNSRRSAGKEKPWAEPGVNFVLSPDSAGKRKERKIRVLRTCTTPYYQTSLPTRELLTKR